jgi:Family of unknown function (DUF6325)
MTLGPLEYIVIGFKEDRSDGSIARELEKLVSAGTIRIVDLVFLAKDKGGRKTILEMSDGDDPRIAPFARLLGNGKGLFTPEDLSQVADSIEPGMAGLVVLFEHRWAEDIKEALQNHGGFLVTRAVIPPEVLAELAEELEGENRVPVA